jgi:hypothetical protein
LKDDIDFGRGSAVDTRKLWPGYGTSRISAHFAHLTSKRSVVQLQVELRITNRTTVLQVFHGLDDKC